MKTVKMSHTQVSRKFHQMNLIKRKFRLPWCLEYNLPCAPNLIPHFHGFIHMLSHIYLYIRHLFGQKAPNKVARAKKVDPKT